MTAEPLSEESDALIPQLDEEHECERVEVVPRAALHLRDHEAAVREALRVVRDWIRHGVGSESEAAEALDAALASSRDTTETEGDN